MIETRTIAGREATVAYLDANFGPAEMDDAVYVRILFDDGDVLTLVADDPGDSTDDVDSELDELDGLLKNVKIAQDAASMSKAEAEYRDGPVKERRCDDCTMFLAEQKRCTLVKGRIKRRGTCKHFEAKGAADKVPPVSVDPHQIEMNVKGYTEQQRGFRGDDAPSPEAAREHARITAGGEVRDKGKRKG